MALHHLPPPHKTYVNIFIKIMSQIFLKFILTNIYKFLLEIPNFYPKKRKVCLNLKSNLPLWFSSSEVKSSLASLYF